MGELGSLLGRWHQWRHHYSHERGYARAVMASGGNSDLDDDLEQLLMHAIESEVSAMPRELQLALQHVARAECLGVEVMFHPLMRQASVREPLVARAMNDLRRRLLRAGVL